MICVCTRILQDRLGDGYQMQQKDSEKIPDLQVFGASNLPTPPEPEPDTETETDTETTAPAAAKVPAAPATPALKPKPQEKKKEYIYTESVLSAVVDYGVRNGFWIVGSIVFTLLTQSGQLVLFQWNDYWANDRFNLGFRRNYLIAIALMVGSQGSKLLKGVTEGFGGERASKSIRLDMQAKLSVLGMPYLWAPEHSTAQMADLVTKDPQQFQQFAVLPLMLSQAAFSLGAVLFANPRLAPLAVIILVAYKFTKKPFGWAIQQVMGGLIQKANISMRKTAGEVFDAAPTISAMGREDDFERITNNEFYLTSLNVTMALAALCKANVHGLIVDTLWALIAMMVVVSMRGKAAPAVGIAIFNQLEDLNNMVGWMWSTVDSVADKMPQYSKIKEFLLVAECVGKSVIEADKRPAPVGWPADGSIEMDGVSFNYATEAPNALTRISLSIKSGEKIGVCGRTGAGKSTLLSILFSLGPLSEGTVKIAGHSLSEISCREVRQRLAIVPQFPTLFEGSIRENLVGGNMQTSDDTDESLLGTLRTCRLEVLAERGLDETLGVLSDGQKQLFCVARALVRRPKILVLDEATADLDTASANELLRVVDAQFKDTTVVQPQAIPTAAKFQGYP